MLRRREIFAETSLEFSNLKVCCNYIYNILALQMATARDLAKIPSKRRTNERTEGQRETSLSVRLPVVSVRGVHPMEGTKRDA